MGIAFVAEHNYSASFAPPILLADLPDRQMSDITVKLYFSVFPKFFCSHPTQITCIYLPVHPTEGRIAIVTDAGLDAVDATASGAQWQSQGEMNLVSGMRRANDPRRSVRQNRVVLASVADAKSAEARQTQPGLATLNPLATVTRTNSSPGRARHKP